MSALVMRINKKTTLIIAALLCIIVAASISACGDTKNDEPEPTSAPVETPKPTPPPSTPEPTPKPVVLAAYDGVVEQIFFHEVIAYPELTFNGNSNQKNFDANMITAGEFNRILESLYRNDFVLINLNDVWSEVTTDNGYLRMQRNSLMLPEGKKPLVISFDNLSFYPYLKGNGFMDRYIVGSDGNIWAEGFDPDGNPVVSQDFTVITILDKFIIDNPGFSHNGAKGCIALTGYEGILGYRTQSGDDDDSDSFRLNRMQEIARVKPVVQRLKETGWYFATHSYGHVNLENMSVASVQADAERWLDEVGSLVGDTKIFIYPFGSRLDGSDVNATGPALRYYQEIGFRIFASVGREPYTQIKNDSTAVILDRMAVDGNSLRLRRERFLRFFDAKEVFDPLRPSEYEVDWQE